MQTNSHSHSLLQDLADNADDATSNIVSETTKEGLMSAEFVGNKGGPLASADTFPPKIMARGFR